MQALNLVKNKEVFSIRLMTQPGQSATVVRF